MKTLLIGLSCLTASASFASGPQNVFRALLDVKCAGRIPQYQTHVTDLTGGYDRTRDSSGNTVYLGLFVSLASDRYAKRIEETAVVRSAILGSDNLLTIMGDTEHGERLRIDIDQSDAADQWGHRTSRITLDGRPMETDSSVRCKAFLAD